MNEDSLGDRMKALENVPRLHLPKKQPVLIRIDGRAFHTLTAHLKAFDEGFISAMAHTAMYLCENVDGCRIAYVQSDEISLLLVDYEKLGTQGWFDHNLQKMVSISASLATAKFNACFLDKRGLMPVFDARAWSVDHAEVENYFIWRQQDAIRNSVQMLGHENFSHKQLHKKNCEDIKAMLREKGVAWAELPVLSQRGFTVIRRPQAILGQNGAIVTRMRWETDFEPPIFQEGDRTYIRSLVYPEKAE